MLGLGPIPAGAFALAVCMCCPSAQAAAPDQVRRLPSPSAKPYAEDFEPPSASLPPHPGAYEHEGFFFRLALGPGFLVMSRSAETNAPSSAPDFTDSQFSGLTFATEIAVGGTPLPGLIVAGTLITHNHPGPELELDDGRTLDLGDGNLSFVIVGASADWYPRPTRGFHVGGTLGAAYAVASSSSALGQIGGVGVGLSGLLGHDFWVSGDWSLGPLLRLSFAYVTSDHERDTVTGSEDSLLVSSALSLAATFN